MKLIGVCGSPRKEGNTEIALENVLTAAQDQGVETEFVALRDYDVRGCTACLKCRETKDGTCKGREDGLDEVFRKVYKAQGLVVGSPVYFGSATPESLAFLQRLGYVARGMDENPMEGKIGAGVAVARRGGQNFTVAELEMSFGPLKMIRAGSIYWPMGFGAKQGDIRQDEEGMKTMGELGRNMAEMIKKLGR